ncbi:MAG: alpha-galactosidase [Tannerellaceae bacterium]|jgi:alpha-galactosidase|nr:alpha-galactosidase [Tannerellaceae bacterium]
MKKKKWLLVLLGIVLVCGGNTPAKVATGRWEISYNTTTKGVTVKKDARPVYEDGYASFKWNDRLITTKEYPKGKVKKEEIHDLFGHGTAYKITYRKKEWPTLVQTFYVYPDKEYILTDFTLESANEISSNYMAPVNTDNIPSVSEKGDNRALFIPFDNDKWIRYQSHPLSFDKLVSYEATAVFDNESRAGLVIGSVEHDHWKTAVELSDGDGHMVGSLVCYGGVADSLTRDAKPHGALKGKRIKSPRLFVGYFSDWRTGLEAYAKANATVAPPKPWDRPVPFGWNSWGVLQFDLTYRKALEVSDFFRDNLQNNSFVNPENKVVIGLDSGWNNFTEEELKDFADRCKANGQIAGIYWTPFTDWGKRPEREIKDAPGYRYKDVYLYANGQPQELDGAYAVDPTHPAIEQQMRKTADLFHRTGFEYVKMDFMTHGALEADTWYNPEIRTGIEAYNYGMQLLDKYFGDMYINLSISPVFPAQYAQSRRIACDAWGKIKDTEYTLNALSYGWWQDEVYQFNDADHIVLQKASEGENRARITSAVMTGIYITGDDFSAGGSQEGKERAKTYLTNADVNAVAKGKAFRPVEGNGESSENRFVMQDEEGTFYLAVFNYKEEELKTTISLPRIGLDAERTYQVKELWSGESRPVSNSLNITVPPKDVLFFRYKVNRFTFGQPEYNLRSGDKK